MSPICAFVSPLAVPSRTYSQRSITIAPARRRLVCAIDRTPTSPKQSAPSPSRPRPRKISVASALAAAAAAAAAAAIPITSLLPFPARSATLTSTPSTTTAAINSTTKRNAAATLSTTSAIYVRDSKSATPSSTSRSPSSSSSQSSIATAIASPPKKSALRAVLPSRGDPLSHNVLKSLLLVGAVLVVVIVSTVAVFWVIQDSLVYKPTAVWRGNPAASGMPDYDDVVVQTSDGETLTGWFVRQPGDAYRSARTLIYFHGTDKNASFRLRKVIGFYEACKCNVLLLSYRGYGRSTGKPNERGVRLDADCAYKYLASRGDVDVGPGGNLWVYGESLGGAVAVHFSERYQERIRALILENTFTSLLDMIKLEFPILGVFRYLSRNRWQSKKRIGQLGIPLLFLSGLKDSYIPPRMMREMHTRATSSPLKEFVEFEKGTHNGTWTMEGFYDTVAGFMDRVEGRDGSAVDQPSETASASSAAS